MRFAALDGWRGVAAVVVCLYHLGVLGTFYELSLIRNGNYFVEFFFVLSGFVLAHAYAGSIRDRMSLAAFIVKRVGRLWPLHLFTLAILVVNELLKWVMLSYGGFRAGTGAFTGTTSVGSLMRNVLLLHGLGTDPEPTWNVPSWSISAEFFTYLLFGWACYRARKHLTPVTVAVSVAAGAAAFVILHMPGVAWARVAVLVCICEFFLGVVIHTAFQHIRARVTLPWKGLEIIALVLIAFLFQFDWLREYVVILPVLFGATILVFAFEAGPVSRILCTRPFQYLGLVSYSIYMVHFVILTGLNSATRAAGQLLHRQLRLVTQTADGPVDLLVLGPAWTGDLVAVAYVAAVVCVATWTFRFVEVPCQMPFNVLAERIRRGGGRAVTERAAPVRVGQEDRSYVTTEGRLDLRRTRDGRNT